MVPKKSQPVLFQYVEKCQLEKIQDSFARAVGIACSIFECATNRKGTPDRRRFRRITRESGCSRFCKIVRTTRKGLRRCKKCDFHWATSMYAGANNNPRVVFKRYLCHTGLVDMIAPIFIGRDIRGFVFGGQRARAERLTAKRIHELARLARQIGVSSDKLMAAYLKLPQMTEAELDNAARHMAEVANQISDLALQVQRFHLVSRNAAALADSTEPSDVYRRILDSAMEVAACKRATLWKYDATRKQLQLLKREVPPSVSVKEQRGLQSVRQLGEGLAGRVAETGKAQGIEDVDKDQKGLLGVKKFLGGMKSEYAVPVKNHGTLIGVLTVKDKRIGKWPKAVTEGLRLLADVAAIAILNARTMQSKQILLETASHELLGPFHAMKMFAQELIQRPEQLSTEDLQCYGRMSLSRMNLAEAHVRNMLLIAREDRTGLQLHDSRVGVPELIERSLQLVNDFAAERQIRLRVTCQPGLPRVHVDERWIADVALRNLVHNAIKYAPAKTNVVISAHSGKDGISIKVMDRGPGVGPEDLPHLGERFFKKDAMGGLGLGLAAVRAIMRVHGGSVTFDSRPGEYFCSAILIPSERTTREASKKNARRKNPRG